MKWPKITPAEVKLYSGFCNASQKDRGTHPVNCVAWPMADNFCRKQGARLVPPRRSGSSPPADRGSSTSTPGATTPRGARFLNACGKECVKWFADHGDRKHKAMYDEDDGFPGTAPVGSFPAGAPPSGVHDLAGNVWEWTSDWFGPYAGATPPTTPAAPPPAPSA